MTQHWGKLQHPTRYGYPEDKGEIVSNIPRSNPDIGLNPDNALLVEHCVCLSNDLMNTVPGSL